ncbi:hypothetical protein MW887_001092 [Aspergillus wentii]|nr:hypothetical protein MW887_001092 [Aspergillus wentii]
MGNPFARRQDHGDDAPREIYGLRIYLVALSATWASAMYGYDSAFIGGTLELPAFKTSFGLTDSNSASLSSDVVSAFQGGAFFGFFFGFFLAERFGRKPVILSSGVVFSIGTALQLVGSLTLLYVGRVLTGLGVGASSMVIPIYIAECSPALIRGRLVGIFEIMLQIALVFGFWVNYGVNENIPDTSATQWRVPVGIQFIPAGLLLFCMTWMIESPRWLASQNNIAKAQANLAWVRHLPLDHEYVVNELAEIQTAINLELEGHGGRRNFM